MTNSKTCLEVTPGHHDPRAPRMGVCTAAGSCGAGDALEHLCRANGLHCTCPKSPKARRPGASSSASSHPSSQPCSLLQYFTEISGEIRLPGVACGAIGLQCSMEVGARRGWRGSGGSNRGVRAPVSVRDTCYEEVDRQSCLAHSGEKSIFCLPNTAQTLLKSSLWL